MTFYILRYLTVANAKKNYQMNLVTTKKNLNKKYVILNKKMLFYPVYYLEGSLIDLLNEDNTVDTQ